MAARRAEVLRGHCDAAPPRRSAAAAPASAPGAGGPLRGVRVVEAAQIISGPLAGMMLADQGADVVKVELANGVGDTYRLVGTHRNGMGTHFHNANRGKRSITLDTKDPRGKEALRRLVRGADVFIQNFRPGAAARMGVGWDEMRRLNPRLVYVSISGFGDSGPLAGRAAYDTVIQGLTGVTHAQMPGPFDVRPPSAPTVVRTLIFDKATAMTVKDAVTAALYAREARGVGGQHVRVNMLDVAVGWLWPDVFPNRMLVGEPTTSGPLAVDFYETSPTADGHVILMVTTATWKRLVAAFAPHLVGDPRFPTFGAIQRDFRRFKDEMYPQLRKMRTAEVAALIERHDLAGAVVAAPEAVFDDPQVANNGTLVEHDAGVLGRVREPRPAALFSATPPSIQGPAPQLGEHTDAVLRGAGYSAAEVAALRAARVAGVGPRTDIKR